MAKGFLKRILSPGPKYSAFYSFFIISLSIFICIPTFCWLFFPENIFVSKTRDFPIKNLFLRSSSYHKLPGIAFSELLGLSADDPVSLRNFSVKHAERILNDTGIFSSIAISKAPDNKGITISYSLKTPIAYVANQSNTLFDLSGNIFPGAPYFPSLNLPLVFFPERDLLSPILPKEKTFLAMELLQEFSYPKLLTIDLTTYDDYPGEIVISLSSGDFLRLPSDTFLSALKLYKSTRTNPLVDSNSSYIYDLRFPDTLLLKKL